MQLNKPETLPCGCIPGYFLCREAERLWHDYILRNGFCERRDARIALREYNKHFPRRTRATK